MSSILDMRQLNCVLSPEECGIIAGMSVELAKTEEKSWLLYREEPGDFVLSFLALLYAGKNIHLPGAAPSNDGLSGHSLFCDDSAVSDFSFDRDAVRVTGQLMYDEYSLVCQDNRIVFHTSGSTGQPKEVAKELIQIENEVEELRTLWGDIVKDSTVYTTVSHQHFYGMLFSILLPLAAGGTICPRRLHYPESLFSLSEGKSSLITSPAFLKRMVELEGNLASRKEKITPFSSGGFLPPGTAECSYDFFGNSVREIYGSTETGGIAWKLSPQEPYWKPFDAVSILSGKEGPLTIRSPFLPGDGQYILEDHIDMKENGTFELCGRKDSIVKIEEKRVALNDLENRLLENELVTDAAVFSLEGRRQFIAAAIELNEKGRETFAGADKKEINQYFRQSLAAHFHPVVIPKKWRYPDKMPVNSQGKLMRSEAKALFDIRLVDFPMILSEEKSEKGWDFVVNFPPEYRYFDGHFPEMKILPAVVQLDWVMSVFKEKTGLNPVIERMPRMKFQNPIFPDRNVKVRITWDAGKGKVGFEYASEEGSRKFSGGSIFVRF